MSKILKVIYSTLAVVMIVNSFVVALPILGHAQATEKQAIQQAEFTEAQKAEIEKVQKEARQAMYKELNLSVTEQKFVEKYADKMEDFNQELDIYVTYNKNNGNATLNISVFYKNLNAIQKATGLSKKEVIILKDIALKMVRNYNKTVNAIKNEIIPAKKTNSIGKNGIAQDTPEVSVTKLILERGIEVTSKSEIKLDFSARSFGPACGIGVWPSFTYTWFTLRTRLFMNDCAVQSISKGYGGVAAISGAIASACFGYSYWNPIAAGCTALASGIGGIFAAYSYLIDTTYWWSCGGRGGLKIYFSNLQITYVQCG